MWVMTHFLHGTSTTYCGGPNASFNLWWQKRVLTQTLKPGFQKSKTRAGSQYCRWLRETYLRQAGRGHEAAWNGKGADREIHPAKSAGWRRVGAPGKELGGGALGGEELLFTREAPAIAGQCAVFANDAMTRYDNGHGVGGAGASDGANGFGLTERAGDL